MMLFLPVKYLKNIIVKADLVPFSLVPAAIWIANKHPITPYRDERKHR